MHTKKLILSEKSPLSPTPQPLRFQPLGWETATMREVILLFKSYFFLKTSVMLFIASFLITWDLLWHMTGNHDKTFPHQFNYPAPFPRCSIFHHTAPHYLNATSVASSLKYAGIYYWTHTLFHQYIYLCPASSHIFGLCILFKKFYYDFYLNHNEFTDECRETNPAHYGSLS